MRFSVNFQLQQNHGSFTAEFCGQKYFTGIIVIVTSL